MREQPDWVKGFWIAFASYFATVVLFALGTFVGERVAAQPYLGTAEPPVWVHDLSSYRAMLGYYLRGPVLLGGAITALGIHFCLRSGLRVAAVLAVAAGLICVHHLLVWRDWMPTQAWYALVANSLGGLVTLPLSKWLGRGAK